MYNYLLLNVGFMVILFLATLKLSRAGLTRRPLLLVLGILLLMTAVFDSLIIALGLVTYDSSRILGLYIIKAPIEDFSYTLVAGLLVPLLWERGAKK